MKIEVGDRVLAYCSMWVWRRPLYSKGTVIAIERWQSEFFGEVLNLKVRWDNRRFGLFSASSWVKGIDVHGFQKKEAA